MRNWHDRPILMSVIMCNSERMPLSKKSIDLLLLRISKFKISVAINVFKKCNYYSITFYFLSLDSPISTACFFRTKKVVENGFFWGAENLMCKIKLAHIEHPLVVAQGSATFI